MMMAWRDDVVMLWPFCGGAVPDDGWQIVLARAYVLCQLPFLLVLAVVPTGAVMDAAGGQTE